MSAIPRFTEKQAASLGDLTDAPVFRGHTGWHFHPKMYPTQAWRDGQCNEPWSAVPLSLRDERVVRAMTYPA